MSTDSSDRFVDRQDSDVLAFGGAEAFLVKRWPSPPGGSLYVGLSGGIGAGKSTVAETWTEMGAAVFSADQLAREVVVAGSPGLAAVAKEFGPQVLTADGELDRARLGQIVFGNELARRKLESITHPLIAERAEALVKEKAGTPVIVYDVPLLVEGGMAEQFDCVVMVDAPLRARLKRLQLRGLDPETATSRIRAQAARGAREPLANIWIENAGSRYEMSVVASKVFKTWLTG